MQKNLDYEMKEKYFKHFIQKMRKYHFHCHNLQINHNFIQDAYTTYRIHILLILPENKW